MNRTYEEASKLKLRKREIKFDTPYTLYYKGTSKNTIKLIWVSCREQFLNSTMISLCPCSYMTLGNFLKNVVRVEVDVPKHIEEVVYRCKFMLLCPYSDTCNKNEEECEIIK